MSGPRSQGKLAHGAQSVPVRRDAPLEWYPGFLPAGRADALFDRLLEVLPWEQRSVRVFGRLHPQPRLVAWLGEPHCLYRYSGLSLVPGPFPEALADLRRELLALTGTDYNCALCNLYRNGHDSVGWHSDNEAELGPDPELASVSLGATRRFQFRHRSKKGVGFEMALSHGSLLVMRAPTQRHWQHRIPREARVQTPRINLTFRVMPARG